MPRYFLLALRLSLFTSLVLVAPSIGAECYSTVSKAQFPRCVVLLDDTYALHWSVNNESVTFGIEIDRTSGWFALGLSEGGGMRAADIWVFRKEASTNGWQVTDSFSSDYVTPVTDDLQDIVISSTSQTATTTTVVFTRKLDTCDVDQDQVIYPQHPQPYIVAFGDEWGYHGPQNRETRFLVLDDGVSDSATTVQTVADKDSKTIPFLMPDLTVPGVETSYMCTLFKAPSDKRYQVIAANYSITPNKMVHHMILSACYSKPAYAVGSTFECSSNPPECSAMMFAWVPGSEPEVMPDTTGFPFGKGSYEYIMLQVHYTNPEGKTGVKDGSGVVATYTSNLRPNDLAVLHLGAEGFEIPPGQEAFSLNPNVCPSECTSRFTSDLNLVASEFHMHQTGAKQTVQRLRSSQSNQLANSAAAGQLQEILPLNYRDYYDFNWQGATFILPGGETLVRGEALITTCTYNTLKRTKPTPFGLSSYDEMCYNYVRYWPAQEIDRCMSIPGSEMNGVALATCANQQKLSAYLVAKNISIDKVASPDVVTDLVAQGFVVQYNTSQYKSFVRYNRTTPQCAAALTSRQQAAIASPPPQPSKSIKSAAAMYTAMTGIREALLAMAVAMVLVVNTVM